MRGYLLAAEVVAGSGDDAAITDPSGATATSVDLAIEGVHFRRETAPAEAIGAKALAAALSDLAAMAAVPGEAYVQMGLPEEMSAAECLKIADGMAAVAREHGVEVLGGDLSRAITERAPWLGQLIWMSRAAVSPIMLLGFAAGLSTLFIILFSFFGAPFLFTSFGYDSCLYRVWTPYGPQWVNACADYGYGGFGYY